MTNKLKSWLPRVAIISCMVLGTAAHAQDHYWELDNDSLLNTATGTAIVSPQPGWSGGDESNVVLDNNGNILLSGGPSSFLTLSGLGQLFPIPGICKNYYSLTSADIAIPHSSTTDLAQIDVSAVTTNISTTGTPSTVGSGTNLYSGGGGGPVGSVAAALQPDGTRYIYRMNNDFSTGFSIYRYTVSPTGSVSAATTVGSFLPTAGINRLVVSPDGLTLAYFDNTIGANLVTYNLATGMATTYNHASFNVPYGTTPGIVRGIVTIGGLPQPCWFLSNGSEMGYFQEGVSNSWVQLSTTKGTNSSLASGKNGNIFFAWNATAPTLAYSLPGAVYQFNPANITAANFATSIAVVPHAHISSVDYSSTSYLFGNHVEGEDICTDVSTSIPLNFTVNSLTGTVAAPADIWICNGTSPLSLSAFAGYYHSNYTIKVEEGSWSAGVFTPSGSFTLGPVTSSTNPLTLDLFSLISGHTPYLAGYYGYIRVTVSVGNGCATGSVQGVFDLHSATAVVNFYMIGPIDANTSNPVCSYMGLSGVQETLPNTSFPTVSQPITTGTPPCAQGWEGASTVGITNGSFTQANVTASNYSISVDEYSSAGVFTQNVLSKSLTAGIPTTSYPFSGKTIGASRNYFVTNYSTIKNNNYYKITLSVVTTECGTVSQSAYFKILDAGADGPFMREAGSTGLQSTMQQVNIFPNPVTDQVHVAWYSPDEKSGNASIVIVNTLGQLMLKKELPQAQGNNEALIDLSSFAPGIYHYILSTVSGESKGSLSKL